MRRHIRIGRVGRHVRVAFCGRVEIGDELIHRALCPGVGVLDVKILFGVGAQVEEPHQRRKRRARLLHKHVVKFPVLPLDRARLRAVRDVDDALAVRFGLLAFQKRELIHAVNRAVFRQAVRADRPRCGARTRSLRWSDESQKRRLARLANALSRHGEILQLGRRCRHCFQTQKVWVMTRFSTHGHGKPTDHVASATVECKRTTRFRHR